VLLLCQMSNITKQTVRLSHSSNFMMMIRP